MFIPYNDNNERVYAYDVNSLYPFAMSNFERPLGNPTYFEGDIYKKNIKLDKDIGFFEVAVESPNIEMPILPYKNINKGHSTTIFPTGN